MDAAKSKLLNLSVSPKNETMGHLRELTGMPSLEEVAAQDAETYINQVAKIKREWFVPENDELKRLEEERYIECEEDKVRFFPKFISTEVENTLTEECWNLAKKHRELRSMANNGVEKKKKKKKKVYEYERFWKTSLSIVKRKLKKVSARIVHGTFRAMVHQRLDILDTNDRRSKWRTPSAKLIADKRCPVFPPVWKTAVLFKPGEMESGIARG